MLKTLLPLSSFSALVFKNFLQIFTEEKYVLISKLACIYQHQKVLTILIAITILLLAPESPFAQETSLWKQNDPLLEGRFVYAVNMAFQPLQRITSGFFSLIKISIDHVTFNKKQLEVHILVNTKQLIISIIVRGYKKTKSGCCDQILTTLQTFSSLIIAQFSLKLY